MSGIDWDMHYQSGKPPWETGQPSAELARVIGEEPIQPGCVIDLGCGSGINAVWLAQQGFDVTAVDFSGRARGAKSKCSRRAIIRSWTALPAAASQGIRISKCSSIATSLMGEEKR
jgi:SAM-dependent methyltransferase